MTVFSMEEAEAMAVEDQTAPISQKRTLSMAEAESLNDVQRNIESPPAKPTFENNVHAVLSDRDRDFYENIAEAFKRGDQAANLDIMTYEASMGRADYEKQIKPIRFEMDEVNRTDPVKGKSFLTDAVYAVSGMIPAMGKGLIKGTEAGLVMGVGAAAVGSPALAPVGFAAGQTTMSLDYWYRQGTGQLYGELRDADVDDAIAVPVSHVAGAIYGAIESSQVFKLIPGGKEAVKGVIAQSSKKFVANLVKQYGVNWVQEVGEEGMQAVVMSVAKDVAFNLADKTSKTALQMIQKGMTSGWSAVKESALPMLLLMAPGAAIDVKFKVDARKAEKQAQAILDKLSAEEKAELEKQNLKVEKDEETADATQDNSAEVKKLKEDYHKLTVREVELLNKPEGEKRPDHAAELKQIRKQQNTVLRGLDKAKEAPAPAAAPVAASAAAPVAAPVTSPSVSVEAEKNRALKEKASEGKLLKKVGEAFTNAGKFLDDKLTPISSQLGRINTKLRSALVKFEANVHKNIFQDQTASVPFLRAVAKMSESDQIDFDFALKNGDKKTVDKIVDKYDMRDAFDARTKVLNGIKERAIQVGFEFEELSNYHPRAVKDVKGFLQMLRNSKEWTLFDEAIREKEKEVGRLDDNERASYLNSLIRSTQEDEIKLSKPGALKERSIKILTADMNQFYHDSSTALLRHIYTVNNAIEARKFFGKAGKGSKAMDNIDGSIGELVLDLLQKDEITGEQAVTLSSVLKDRFNERGPDQFVGLLKNVAYVDILGSPISAVTQLTDIAFSLYKNGYYRTGKSLLKSLTRQKQLNKEDVFLSTQAQEFSDSRESAKLVKGVFKAVGFEMFDNLGKATFINSAFDRLQSAAKNPDLRFMERLDSLFGEEAESVAADLEAGKVSENVKTLLFSELLDVQPIALSEMPPQYNRGGNGRVFYMLKSYTIKQLDIYRRDVIDKMKTDPVEALQNFTKLSTALMLMGVGADGIKDFILGRDFDLGDSVVNNILKLMGFNRYLTTQVAQKGPVRATLESILPPLRILDSLFLDAGKVLDHGFYPEEWDSIRSIPVGGELFYWWVGAGRSKIQGSRGKAPEAP